VRFGADVGSSGDGCANIIVILADDQTIGTLRAMPNVRALIKGQGTDFSSAYVSNPICCPSRASILTGLYSHGTMTYTNQVRRGPRDPWQRYGGAYAFHEVGNNENRTLAHYLHEQGYYTGLIGKYLNGYKEYADAFRGDGSEGSGAGWKPGGWDRWVSFYENNGEYLDYDLNIDGQITHFGVGPRDHSTRVLGNKAVRFIQNRPDQPFFLFFTPFAAHGSFIPEERDEDMFLDTKAFDSPAVSENVRDKPTYIRDRPKGGFRTQRHVSASCRRCTVSIAR
jgi:arylsulfatase A-like enzyme